jgi:hypothetical protein
MAEEAIATQVAAVGYKFSSSETRGLEYRRLEGLSSVMICSTGLWHCGHGGSGSGQ